MIHRKSLLIAGLALAVVLFVVAFAATLATSRWAVSGSPGVLESTSLPNGGTAGRQAPLLLPQPGGAMPNLPAIVVATGVSLAVSGLVLRMTAGSRLLRKK